MAGSGIGVRKSWAKRLGIPVEEYLARLAAGEKWCGGCKVWHPHSEFGKDRSRADGLAAVCLRSRVKAAGRPGVRERRRQGALGQRWCRGCQGWLAADLVSHQGLCRPHAAEDYRNRYAEKPDAIRSRATARKRGLDPTPVWWRQETFEQFGHLCAYGCGRPATALDHVWPVVRGGKSCPSNLVPACKPCNSSKKDRDPWPWVDRGMSAFPREWLDLIALDLATTGYLEVA